MQPAAFCQRRMTASTDRRAMIAKVHIAKKDLRLDDGAYRAVIERVTRKTSSRDCADPQLAALLTEFQRLGWKPEPAQRRISSKPWVRMIYGIWSDLRPLLDNADDDTLRAFVRRQTHTLKNPAGIADPEWLDAKEATKVINGLEGWLGRERAKQTQGVSEHAV
jgi:hypothetical protein